jgi:NADH:ubiquinone oxidoreductase subunit E
MPNETSSQITICMGSSCFSRGNNRNIEVIQNYLNEKQLTPRVELTGHLCEGHCRVGPNITINGQMHHEVNPVTIIGFLDHCLVKDPS